MVFEITEETLERHETFEESDLGQWALMLQGTIVEMFTDEEEARQALRDATVDSGLDELAFNTNVQCDDGDDNEDDQGGVWGEDLGYDNTVGEGEWSDEEVRCDW